MDLLNDFKKFIINHRLFEAGDRLLLAVSGGVDSVVLCDLCHRAGLDTEIAHVNFQLRGEDSQGDEAFVSAFADQLGMKFHVKRFDTKSYAEQQGVNTQMAARQLRYDWFNEIMEADAEQKFKYVLTAHHASDNAETMLMHFLKGTGIRGLKGMSPSASGIGGKVVRPLLFARRHQIEAYATWRQLQWREDASNASDSYLRNVIRNEWLPMIRLHIPEIEENLIDNIQRLQQAATIYEEAVHHFIRKIIIVKDEEIHVPVLRIKQHTAAETLLFEIIHPYGFNSRQLTTALSLLQSATGKYLDSPTHRLLRNRNWLIITPLIPDKSDHLVIEKNQCDVVFAGQKLQIETTNKLPSADASQAFLNLKKIQFPLLLRKWREGDYFYPLGMNKKKKISKFLIDNKVPLHQKSSVWVLESGSRIVWVVGMRIDERFKALPGETSLHLRVLSSE